MLRDSGVICDRPGTEVPACGKIGVMKCVFNTLKQLPVINTLL